MSLARISNEGALAAESRIRHPGSPGEKRTWVLLHGSLLVVLALTGCVSKSKAKAQAREAFLAGQNQALMRMQQNQGPSVRLVGEVRNPQVPWTEDLTLAKAVVAAEYYGRTTPRTIFLVRNGVATSIDPKSLLGGQDLPLQPGDIIELKN